MSDDKKDENAEDSKKEKKAPVTSSLNKRRKKKGPSVAVKIPQGLQLEIVDYYIISNPYLLHIVF